jgi:2,3,4,5-tetrahydropyridine-2-carboxylate N-succinyltransferase
MTQALQKDQSGGAQMKDIIESAWEQGEALSAQLEADAKAAVAQALDQLDQGALRVATPAEEHKASGESRDWIVHEWVKKAVLLSFRFNPMNRIEGGPGGAFWYDKVESKFSGWTDENFDKAGFRAVPGAIVRRSAYIAPKAVLMPSFVNIGAYVGEGTMVDSWATIGSCAQVGANCHISGGTGIGGVLEPLQAAPVIIEDNVFIGARSEIAEGVYVGRGAVISMGVFIGASTKVIDRQTGEIFMGQVPPYSVVVPGTLPSDKVMQNGAVAPSLACAVIVKRVDEQTRSKTSINALLRDS